MASKKSKILAMALCASVMTGIYASPVMADGQISGINVTGALGAGLVAQDSVIINGVELSDEEVKAKGGNFTQLTVTNGMGITGGKLTVGDTIITSIDSTNGNTVVGGTLTAAGAASLNGGLKVTGNANLEKLNVNGKLTVDAISGVVADNLTVDTNANVQGNLTVENLLTAGATNVSSLAVNTDKFTVDVYGNTTVGGKLAAGSGNFTVDTDGNTTIIGADKQLTVEGTAQIGTMTATTAQVGGGLTVVGETTLAGLTAKGAADLQDGLTVSEGATVNGGLTVDTDRFVVDGVTGNTTVGGTLNVTGDTTLANTKVNGTLTAGETDVESLDVAKNATVGGTLTAGATTVDSLTVKGAATVDSLEFKEDIKSANGAVEITKDGNMTLAGHATISNGATIQKGLSVTGGASVDGNFAVTNGGLSVSGGESVLNGGLTVNNGDTKLNGKLNVGAGNFEVDKDGNTAFNGNLNIGHGNFTVDAATGDTVVKGSLELGTLEGREVGQAIKDLEAYAGDLKDANLPDKVGGIERNPAGAGDPGDGTTTIEGMAKFDSEGMTIGNTVVTDGAITTNTINAGGTIINNAGMTVGDTVVADSKITVGAADDQTIIEGGAITAKSLVLGTKDVCATIAGIERETVTDEFGTVNTTTIEGALKVSDNGLISNADGSFTVDSYGGLAAGGGTFAADITGITMKAPVQMFLQGDNNYKGISVIDLGTTISDIDDRLDVLEDKTQNIKPGTGAGTGTGEGGTAAGEDNNIIEVPATEDGHTGINGDVTVGGEINAGAGNIGGVDIADGTITTGETTIDGEGINTGNGDFSGEVNVGGNTNITGDGITTGNGEFTGNVTVGGDITADTGDIGGIGMAGGTITTGDTNIDGSGINTGNGNFTGNVTVGGDITADTGDIGGIGMAGGTINTGNTTIDGDGMTVGVGTDIKDGNITVKGNEGKVEIGKGDVAIFDENGEKVTSIQHNYDEINRVEEKFDGEVNRLDNRITKVEDRIDKVGAMSAAIANLRTMGYDPAAPTEIAVGVGQYRSETGVALGMFHYPNKDFMLSLSVSTSGDEVMGGIGATWKFGRKSPEKVLAAEKEKAAKAKLAKAEAMKKAAKEAKIKAQQERHAKLAAERAAQAEAAK